jgi:cell division protein YceG involved in septum cleavage
MTMEEIMREMQHGRLPTVRLTIPEGWRAEQIADLLEQVGPGDHHRLYGPGGPGQQRFRRHLDRPEGLPPAWRANLFPDTTSCRRRHRQQIVRSC